MATPDVAPSSSPSPPVTRREVPMFQEVIPIDEGANPGHLPTDEVYDETDQAQLLQLMEQAAISQRARELGRAETHPDFDGAHCVECGDDMPQARLTLRRVRCVHCQTFLEEQALRVRRTVG